MPLVPTGWILYAGMENDANIGAFLTTSALALLTGAPISDWFRDSYIF